MPYRQSLGSTEKASKTMRNERYNRNLHELDVTRAPVLVYISTHRDSKRSRMGVLPLHAVWWDIITDDEAMDSIRDTMIMQAKAMPGEFGDLLRAELAKHGGQPTGKKLGWRNEVYSAFDITIIGKWETEADALYDIQQMKLQLQYDFMPYRRRKSGNPLPWRLRYVFGFAKAPIGGRGWVINKLDKATGDVVATFSNLREAAKDGKVSVSGMHSHCTQQRDSAGPYIYRYAE